MLIKDILAERSNRQLTTVQFDQEIETSPGEWDTRTLTIRGFVDAERDPFGTGDSPTEYSFEPQQVLDPQGNEVDPNSLSDSEWAYIEDEAIRNAS